MEGLGGFRNILVHRYLEIDPAEVLARRARAFEILPRFAREILAWLDRERPDSE